MDTLPAIQFCDVSFSYDGHVEVLQHLKTCIAKGEYVAVLGSNGSGKSTFARCINGLVVPDSGEVRIFGTSTATPAGASYARRHVGMVFQNPDNQAVNSIVADDVAFGPENLGVPQPQIAARVDEALTAVGMLDYAEHDMSELSGGQRQRVAIAGALAMHPDILVLDEPTAMLDPSAHQDILDTLHSLAQTGITIVHVTHAIDDAVFADRILIIDAGTIVGDGTPEEVLSDAEGLRNLHLEPPFALQLAQRLNEIGVNVPHSIHLDAIKEALCQSRLSR